MNKRIFGTFVASVASVTALALTCTAAAPSHGDVTSVPRTSTIAVFAPLAANGSTRGHPRSAIREEDPRHELAVARALTLARDRAALPEHNSRMAVKPRRTLLPGPPAEVPPGVRSTRAPRLSEADVAVRVALAQRGKPYVWGATGPNAFDCSGLIGYAYRTAGIRLPRTTWDQIDTGRRIPTSALRPGDLVFYREAAHVGMYIGGGRIVHAPRPGTSVKVADLHIMGVYAAVRPY